MANEYLEIVKVDLPRLAVAHWAGCIPSTMSERLLTVACQQALNPPPLPQNGAQRAPESKEARQGDAEQDVPVGGYTTGQLFDTAKPGIYRNAVSSKLVLVLRSLDPANPRVVVEVFQDETAIGLAPTEYANERWSRAAPGTCIVMRGA